jgi:hypothetical protein
MIQWHDMKQDDNVSHLLLQGSKVSLLIDSCNLVGSGGDAQVLILQNV